MANRLANETSPYLLQHAHNPVDWYPWGPEAMERARAEERPILLSVGYSACHWCHVMERESFENHETAALMNELFVNIKVDREERPDVDSIYMTAVQQMTGHGGWPMTMFLTPAGEPFYGGTYYPPEARYGMPSFRQVLRAVAEAWRDRRDDVVRSAGEMRDALAQSAAVRPSAASSVDASVLDAAEASLAGRFDARWGGFGGAPKFPQAMTLEYLLRQWKRTGGAEALRMAETTLRRMAEGGMYDHVGGGFARYSVDAQWLVPHFEKMLYDNALLARAYLHAWQATHDDAHRRVVEETLGWVEREMTSPGGGFYSALDADSEGEEGKFYLWTPDEVDALLGPEDGPLFRRYYDVSEGGNFEGRNILHTAHALDDLAPAAGVAPERLRAVVERGRRVLYEARAKRVWPGLDDKVLASWNAMMLHAFAEAARVFEREDWRAIAVRSAEFLTSALRPEGRLLRTYKGGRAKIPAFLEDHALLVDALVAVYEATWDARWVREARSLADDMLAHFWEDGEGVFYDTASDAEALVVRPRDVFDNATPSGNSAAVMALLRLGELTGEARYREVAERVLAGMGDLMARVPMGFGHLLCALDFSISAPVEIAIVGDAASDEARALLRTVSHAYLPNAVLAGKGDGDGGADDLIPLLRDRAALGGRATAYVCERLACQQPVTDPATLAEQLGI
ncbi:thioredoxin domain-containing protein [Longimicrobium sp.]|uniref:thioredoxin domain-containing protein n=1 Tax=Longimicrobium sp. TaxID=2029185 RepID=UPI002CF3659D|nr:thioredoxin domain-containing protein [Longimicrobium sp.]HSU13155.1 thioredoxin domain-containing protein [Longimicrobium sp.]